MQVQVGKLSFNAHAVAVARMIATTAGYDCDVEPMAPGLVKVTATGPSTLRSSGRTAEEACERIIEKLIKEMNGTK